MTSQSLHAPAGAASARPAAPRSLLFRAAAAARAAMISLAATACSGPQDAQSRDLSQPAWLQAPPRGCHVGASLRTLHPADRLRNAIEDGFVEVAAQLPTSRTTTQSWRVVESGPGEQTTGTITGVRIEGTVRGAYLVDLWTDHSGRASVPGHLTENVPLEPYAGAIYALVCDQDATPRLDSPLASRVTGGLCGLGVLGPTLIDDRQERLEEVAREALALRLETEVLYDRVSASGGQADLEQVVRPTPAALARARNAPLVHTWLDETREGPLGAVGVSYGIACLEP